MSHQKGFYIPATTTAEFFVIRAALRELGYTIFKGFDEAPIKDLTKNWSMYFKGVRLGNEGVCRTNQITYGEVEVTLAQFIENQFIPVKTPAQIELEKLEASAAELNTRIAALKATI